eukprot:15366837-Ditylum_brightwellii.AAC.3
METMRKVVAVESLKGSVSSMAGLATSQQAVEPKNSMLTSIPNGMPRLKKMAYLQRMVRMAVARSTS